MKKKTLLMAGTALAACAPTMFACKERPQQPNVIIILADDLGYGDLSCNGNEYIETPNVDRLAQTGVRFDRFYTAPVSSPTRAGLMTGMYPTRVGIRENVIKPWLDFGLDTSYETMADMFAQAGYANRAVIGKWHLGSRRQEYWPTNRGFTHFRGMVNGANDYFTHVRDGEHDWHNDNEPYHEEGYLTDLIADHSVECIEQYSKEGPYFMYVAFNAPHAPIQAKEADIEYYAKKIGKEVKDLTPQELRQVTYYGMVGCMDQGIGRILDAVEKSGQWDNTMILFFSDNGPTNMGQTPFRGKKGQEWEGGMRSPAYLSWPAFIKGDQNIAQVTGFVDVLPTLRDYLGLDAPAKPYDGISILPVLEGKQKNIERDMYLGIGAIVNEDYKFIEANRSPFIQVKEDFFTYLPQYPLEQVNDIDKPEYKDEVARMRAEAHRFDATQPANSVPLIYQAPADYVPMKEWNPFLD